MPQIQYSDLRSSLSYFDEFVKNRKAHLISNIKSPAKVRLVRKV
jgi:hypothetical protein